MRTMHAFGDIATVIVEDTDSQGSLRITATGGTLNRHEVQELTAWLTGHLRETQDNVPQTLELPLEWKDGPARG